MRVERPGGCPQQLNGEFLFSGSHDEIEQRTQPRGLPHPEGGSMFESVLGDRSMGPLLFAFMTAP